MTFIKNLNLKKDVGFGWVFEFDVGVAVSRLTQRCAFRELITTPKLPDFLARKHGDFFALSLIFLPYILPNLLNKSKR